MEEDAPIRIKLRRPEELATSPGEAWRGKSSSEKTPFSAFYLPISALEFTE